MSILSIYNELRSELIREVEAVSLSRINSDEYRNKVKEMFANSRSNYPIYIEPTCDYSDWVDPVTIRHENRFSIDCIVAEIYWYTNFDFACDLVVLPESFSDMTNEEITEYCNYWADFIIINNRDAKFALDNLAYKITLEKRLK